MVKLFISMKKNISIRIDPEVLAKIKKEARRQDRTVSSLINRMLDIQTNYFPAQSNK